LVIDIQRSLNDVNVHDFVQTIDDVIRILEIERQTGSIIGGKVSGGFIELQIPENLVIIGDIHGDLKSFIQIMYDIDFEEFLANPNNKVIFLGDYVDRGSSSIEVLYSICYLKRKFPNSIILMRGNHEAPVEFPFSPHDLPDKIIGRYGLDWGKLIYVKKILRFFRLLTLATLIQNQLFIVHGGLPTEDIRSIIDFRMSIANAQENHSSDRILEELLWNDPLRNSSDRQNYSKRGFGRLFGINISRKWLDMSETKVIIRGHEPCQGFKIDHECMVLTLFSCREAYPDCEASYIMMSIKELQSIHNGMELTDYVININ
jgi:diadenosine tetraphosphatase ApaH/serine/threonine PP2A family protein phosphatase